MEENTITNENATVVTNENAISANVVSLRVVEMQSKYSSNQEKKTVNVCFKVDKTHEKFSYNPTSGLFDVKLSTSQWILSIGEVTKLLIDKNVMFGMILSLPHGRLFNMMFPKDLREDMDAESMTDLEKLQMAYLVIFSGAKLVYTSKQVGVGEIVNGTQFERDSMLNEVVSIELKKSAIDKLNEVSARLGF